MRSALAPLLFALLLAGWGCASAETRESVTLQDVTWRLVEAGGAPAQSVPAGARAAHFRLSAAEKRASGFSGVNQFGGGYELSGQSLRFGALAMTKMAGPPALMDQETAFTDALTRTASWRAAGTGRIELLDAGGKRLASFEREGG